MYIPIYNAKVNGAQNVRPVERSGTMFDRLVRFALNMKIFGVEMKDIMLDLETMGNSTSAAICAIGAVEFDLESGILGREFYTIVNLESSVKAGGVVDASTILWWMKQSDEARSELQREGQNIEMALVEFSHWLNDCGFDREHRLVWGNGAAFDNVILRNAYEKTEIKTPWEFWGDRCYRTAKNLLPSVELVRTGLHHCAVDDARDQARHLIELVRT